MKKRQNIPFNHQHIYYSQRYGMSDNISFNLADAGCNVSKNVPYGSMIPLLTYLLKPSQDYSLNLKHSSRELELYKQEIKRRGI